VNCTVVFTSVNECVNSQALERVKELIAVTKINIIKNFNAVQ